MITTKLDQTRLDKETMINREDDAASRLFNGVQHMYNHINVAKSREKEAVSTVGISENMVDVLDKVMVYKSSKVIVPNMDDHVLTRKTRKRPWRMKMTTLDKIRQIFASQSSTRMGGVKFIS